MIYKILPDENTAADAVADARARHARRIGTGLKWPEYAALAADPRNGLRGGSRRRFRVVARRLQPPASDRQRRPGAPRARVCDRQERNHRQGAHGSAIPAKTDQQPHYSWAYTDDIAHYPYDPAKAAALLDADGWKVGPDGIRVKNGQRLEFTLSTQTESNNGKANETVLQRQWRDVGVQADVKNYPTSQFFDNSANGMLQGGHYDVALFAWIGAADPDDSAIYSGDNLAPHGQNAMFWDNRRRDRRR